MTIRDKETVPLGSYFIEVYCLSEECKSPHFGEKIIFSQHNGYASSGAVEISPSQIEEAMKVAKTHDREHPKHEIRVVQGTN